jgi:hypothetical protein
MVSVRAEENNESKSGQLVSGMKFEQLNEMELNLQVPDCMRLN